MTRGNVHTGSVSSAAISDEKIFEPAGDLTQVDLPKNQKSGLEKATRILRNIDGIAHIVLDEEDVVRHRLVKAIIRAYDREKEKEQHAP